MDNSIDKNETPNTDSNGTIQIVIPLFDTSREDLYEYNKPKERTLKRLTEMANLGMEETGTASFGYKNVMSGLYIEKVWGYSDSDFSDYMKWVKDLIKEKSNEG
jgi:hypothetical protein